MRKISQIILGTGFVLTLLSTVSACKSDSKELAEKAAAEGAQIALYGHTHDAREENAEGVALFNPGTLSRYAARQSYLYLAVYNGKFTGKIVDIS